MSVVRGMLQQESQSSSGSGEAQSESHWGDSDDKGCLGRGQVFKYREAECFLMDLGQERPSPA